MPKKEGVELTEFSVGLTVPTGTQYFMIRFDITGKAADPSVFLRVAGPQIKEAINEIAKECGLEPVFK